MKCSCEKFTVSRSITRGVFVRPTAFSIRALLVCSVVIYDDVTSPTKNGSVRGTTAHCAMLVSVLCQLHRIVSFDVVEGEEKSFPSIGVTT